MQEVAEMVCFTVTCKKSKKNYQSAAFFMSYAICQYFYGDLKTVACSFCPISLEQFIAQQLRLHQFASDVSPEIAKEA